MGTQPKIIKSFLIADQKTMLQIFRVNVIGRAINQYLQQIAFFLQFLFNGLLSEFCLLPRGNHLVGRYGQTLELRKMQRRVCHRRQGRRRRFKKLRKGVKTVRELRAKRMSHRETPPQQRGKHKPHVQKVAQNLLM